MTINLHRNWEAAVPEVTGKFYFSGTVGFAGIGLSFEPHSIKLKVVKKEDGSLRAILCDEEIALTFFDGRWLGPEPEGEVWQ